MDKVKYKSREAEYEDTVNFRNDAIRDGWSIEPTYAGESENRSCTMKRDGYTMMIITRDSGDETNAYRYGSSVAIWGADGLGIEPSFPYNFKTIVDGTKKCDFCHATVEKTFRVAFANRSCKDCLPAAKAKLERAGWCS
jgi:hypothetical protein